MISVVLKSVLNVVLFMSIWPLSGAAISMAITNPVPLDENGNMTQTSCFSRRIDPITRQKTQWHHGVDIRAAINTPLYAPVSGEITAISGHRTLTNGGLQIGIIDKLGNRHIFLHLEDNQLTGKYRSVPLKEGDAVVVGTVIGLTGNTGKRTTGPHLHWQITNEQGQWVNPLKFLNPDNTVLAANCKKGPTPNPNKGYKKDRPINARNKARSCERGYEPLNISNRHDWESEWEREFELLNRRLLY